MSLEVLRKQGFLAETVEKVLPYKFIRVDLFGAIDHVAVVPTRAGCLGVQSTSREHVLDHKRKAEGLLGIIAWLKAGNRFEVWGWDRLPKEAGRGFLDRCQVVRAYWHAKELRIGWEVPFDFPLDAPPALD